MTKIATPGYAGRHNAAAGPANGREDYAEMLVVAGNITIDDVVMPDGRTAMGTIGGDALYTALGAALWTHPVGLLCRKGDDFPTAAIDRLRAANLNLDGMIGLPGPTNRFWVLYEDDGRRTFFLRSPEQRYLELAPEPEDLPPSYSGAVLVHLAAMPFANVQRLAGALTAGPAAPLLTLDTHESYISGYQEALTALLPSVAAFLPSREEVSLWFGDDDPERRIIDLLQLGPRTVVIKLGPEGALLMDAGLKRPVWIPSVPVRAIDVTGAGDAFCGGFAAQLARGARPVDAAAAAAVSASFAVEQQGSLGLISVRPEERDERYAAIKEKMHAG